MFLADGAEVCALDADLLELRELKNGLDGLLLRLADEPARIDDDDLCLRGILDKPDILLTWAVATVPELENHKEMGAEESVTL